jgi:hypothetical protein
MLLGTLLAADDVLDEVLDEALDGTGTAGNASPRTSSRRARARLRPSGVTAMARPPAVWNPMEGVGTGAGEGRSAKAGRGWCCWGVWG